jgi:hypothetical protein
MLVSLIYWSHNFFFCGFISRWWCRLGVGATREVNGTAATNGSMAKETARLHGRLAGKKRSREEDGDHYGAGSTASLTNGVTKKLGRATLNATKRDEESDEEEESRAATISNKNKGGDGKVSTAGGNPIKDRFALPGQNKKKKKNQEDNKINSVVMEGSKDRDTGENERSSFTNPFSLKRNGDALFRVPDIPISNTIPTKEARDNTTSSPKKLDTSELRGTSSDSTYSDPSNSNPTITTTTSSSSNRKLSSPRTSPVMSLSSSTSRGSKSLARRSLLKQEAFASWSLVSVEKVVQPSDTETKQRQNERNGSSPSHPSHQQQNLATPKKERIEANNSRTPMSQDLPLNSVLQLTPLSQPVAPATLGSLATTTEQQDVVEESEVNKKKKRRRKKHKKKDSAASDAQFGSSAEVGVLAEEDDNL